MSDSEIQEAKKQADDKMMQFRKILNEKSVLYDQLYTSAQMLIQKDQLIVENEERIMKLKLEIDISTLEMQ
jgi:hypothetical protein